MTIAQAKQALPGIKQDVLDVYNPAVNVCIKASCSDLQFYSYSYARETGNVSATLVFRSGRLASFDWADFDWSHTGRARDAAIKDRWRKNYGPPEKMEADTGGSMVGEWLGWEDQHTRLSILKGPGAVGGLEMMIDDLTAERKMREEAEQLKEQSKPLTLVADTYGFPSYAVYRKTVDKVARLRQGRDLTEEETLNLILQLGVGALLPAGTKVTRLAQRGAGESNVMRWALKVRVLNGANVGETLWVPALQISKIVARLS